MAGGLDRRAAAAGFLLCAVRHNNTAARQLPGAARRLDQQMAAARQPRGAARCLGLPCKNSNKTETRNT